MDESYSDCDVPMSPTQVLERLQILRQLQLMQRGKLQKQCLQYQENAENSSSITEIVSHFTNSTSFNTFRSLLQSPLSSTNEDSPQQVPHENIEERDFIDGISVLNLSQESEFVINSPVSSKSSTSVAKMESTRQQSVLKKLQSNKNSVTKSIVKKNILLDDMPILSPKKDFEALVIEKLQHDNAKHKENSLLYENNSADKTKRPFLKRGEGTARFGVNKNVLVIQNTKSLPWKSKNPNIKNNKKSNLLKNKKNDQIENLEPQQTAAVFENTQKPKVDMTRVNTKQDYCRKQNNESTDTSNCELHSNKPTEKIIQLPKGKHPLVTNKGRTWAAVLTKEQSDFLHELKQSDYYKNFASPAKSTVSDQSCDENLLKLRQEREIAEQNMFELLEKKVSKENFNLENSFFNRFLNKNVHEYSGESTPLTMQKCLVNNPDLLYIFPNQKLKQRKYQYQSENETCASDYTECCSDTCSSVSSCCSCKTVEHVINSNNSHMECTEKKKCVNEPKRSNKTDKMKAGKLPDNKESQNNVTENEVMKANMVEMNAKLITTSELLKERLCDLEDEIETFRKENAKLLKLREEVDLDKQKFYEEKKMYEEKLNEEKILSEFFLAEEKEKLTKQKQTYERYVREMKGRLNKKERDEVISLKKEIEHLKEEIRIKDAKSTSTIARLRNQIKIIEKEKKDLLNEVEKLKKENRRIQHSNDITRRLTNMKYLEQINKKLSNMTSIENRSAVNIDSDAKYKDFEIERQSRKKKIQPTVKGAIRPRAKSVPNINVTSRYARYFSQRDTVSEIEQNKTVNVQRLDNCIYDNEESDLEADEEINISQDGEHENITSDNNSNNLEKLYMETFRSSKSSLSSTNSYTNPLDKHSKTEDFFLHNAEINSSSVKVTKSPTYGSRSSWSKSPVSILSHTSHNKSPENSQPSEFIPILSKESNNSNRSSRSPVSVTNHSTQSQKSATVIHNSQHSERSIEANPGPSTSRTTMGKTYLNPTELRKPDGSKELRFPNGNVKHISSDGIYSKFMYYNGDIKENFFNEGRIKYFYSETKTFHTTHADGLEILEFPDGQVEKRYRDGSTEIRLTNGSIRYFDPKNEHVREEWRFPDGTALTVSANGEQRVVFGNGQIEVHAKDHKRRQFPDGTVKLVYNDGTSETRYASGRVRIKDRYGNLIMDSTPK